MYGPLLTVLRGWKGKGPFLELFYKDNNAIYEGSTPITNHRHQRFHSKVLTLWVRLSPYEFGEGEHKYSDHKSVPLSTVTQSCLTLCDPLDCSTPGFPVHHQHPELAQTHVISLMPSNQLILCRPLLLLPSIFLSIRVFSTESVLHIMWPKYWSFSFNISPSNEYSGLIFFRIDWFDLLTVQGTLKSLLQHYNSKASIFHSSYILLLFCNI